jgi:hypothetical protein
MNATSAAHVWMPRLARFIRTRFEARCYWCGYAVSAGSSAAFYIDEKAVSHTSCHRETCS